MQGVLNEWLMNRMKVVNFAVRWVAVWRKVAVPEIDLNGFLYLTDSNNTSFKFEPKIFSLIKRQHRLYDPNWPPLPLSQSFQSVFFCFLFLLLTASMPMSVPYPPYWTVSASAIMNNGPRSWCSLPKTKLLLSQANIKQCWFKLYDALLPIT